MRALCYTSSPAWTGGARAAAAAARGLAERGHRVTYVCPSAAALVARVATVIGTAAEVVPVEAGAPFPLACWRLQRIIGERLVDAIVVEAERDHLVAAVARRLAGRRAGGVVRRTGAGERLEMGADTRLALRLAPAAFLFTSAADARTAAPLPPPHEPLIAELGVPVGSYDRIRPTPVPLLGASAGAQLIACVCDAAARSRLATVFRVVAMLLARHPALHVALLGDGTMDDALRMHAAALGISAHVSFLGPRDDEPAVLRTAAIAWILADGDTAAFAVLDSMALDRPVLVDRGTVGQRYVADGITGLALAPGDVPAAAAAVAALLSSETRRAAMGAAGCARVAREYPAAAMVDAFERAISFQP